MAVTHDDNYFDVVEITGERPEILTGVVQSGVVQALDDGDGACFFAPAIVDGGTSYTCCGTRGLLPATWQPWTRNISSTSWIVSTR